jgi:hypothetical protein
MSPVELGTKNHCAGKGRQQFSRQASQLGAEGTAVSCGHESCRHELTESRQLVQ